MQRAGFRGRWQVSIERKNSSSLSSSFSSTSCEKAPLKAFEKLIKELDFSFKLSFFFYWLNKLFNSRVARWILWGQIGEAVIWRKSNLKTMGIVAGNGKVKSARPFKETSDLIKNKIKAKPKPVQTVSYYVLESWLTNLQSLLWVIFNDIPNDSWHFFVDSSHFCPK